MSHPHANVTEARAIRVKACDCPADRYPTLKRMGSRSKLVRYVCQACGRKGINSVNAEGAARNWNRGDRH